MRMRLRYWSPCQAAERFRIRAIFDLGNLPRSTCLGALLVGLRGSAPEDESTANKRESYDNQRDPQSMHFATAKTEMKCEQVQTDGSGQSVRKATKRRFFARTVGIRTLAAGRAAAIAPRDNGPIRSSFQEPHPQQPVTCAQVSARQASLCPAPSRGMLLLKTQAVPPRRNPIRKDCPKLPRRRNSRSHHVMDAISVHTT